MLVLLVSFTLGVSFAVLPAEDVLDAVYDESEPLPCESIQVFSVAMSGSLAQAPTVWLRPFPLYSSSLRRTGARTFPSDQGGQ
jgi:hypothetical protein